MLIMEAALALDNLRSMKHIGFLSFGHWSDSRSSPCVQRQMRCSSRSIRYRGGELGANGAYFHVHHFARQLASPFPLLAAVRARTARIEIGQHVMTCATNPLTRPGRRGGRCRRDGRLQLGISRGSPEQVIDGFRHFGHQPAKVRRYRRGAPTHRSSSSCERGGLRSPTLAHLSEPARPAAPKPYSPGLRDRIWSRRVRAPRPSGPRREAMNLTCSTLIFDESGEPPTSSSARSTLIGSLGRGGPRPRTASVPSRAASSPSSTARRIVLRPSARDRWLHRRGRGRTSDGPRRRPEGVGQLEGRHHHCTRTRFLACRPAGVNYDAHAIESILATSRELARGTSRER